MEPKPPRTGKRTAISPAALAMIAAIREPMA